MGNQQDIMHGFVQQEIKRYFSGYDGWNIVPVKQGAGYDSIMSVERFINGKMESVKILVTFRRKIPQDLLAEMRDSGTTDAMRSRPSYAVLAPAKADFTGLPGDVRAYEMKAFALDGDEIVWLKKPVQKTTPPAGTKVAGKPA